MYKYAQILNNKVHLIFEDQLTLEEIGQRKFNLNQIELVDVTNVTDVQEGYDYIDGVFSVPVIVTPQLTQEEIVLGYVLTVQKYLDDTAKTRGYDGIISLCSYKGSTDPIFDKEGTAGVVWRDAVWRKCYDIRDAIIAGIRTELPTDIISELPEFTWGD